MSPEIKDAAEQDTPDPGQQDEGMSPQARERLLAQFEARIDRGDFDGRPFHNLVKEELYPLLGEGELAEEAFGRLVRKWARKNYPFDWPVRSYQDGP